MFYHGTDNGSLTQLSTQKSKYDGKIFVTNREEVAIWYTVKTFWYMYGKDERGNITFDEVIPNQLEKMYKGKTGYIYTCENLDYEEYQSPVPNAWVSTKDVCLTSKKEISDVYQHILMLAEEGKIKISFYNDLSPAQQQKRHKRILNMISKFMGEESPEGQKYLKTIFKKEYQEFLKIEKEKKL